MSFVTAGSAACAASTENSLRATSAMLLWTAEASQVDAMVVSCSGVFYAEVCWSAWRRWRSVLRCEKRSILMVTLKRRSLNRHATLPRSFRDLSFGVIGLTVSFRR